MRNAKALLSVVSVLITANVISAYPSLAIQVDGDSAPPTMVKQPVPVAGSVETAQAPVAPMAPVMMKSDVMPSGVQQPGSMLAVDVMPMAVAAPPMPAGDVRTLTATGMVMPDAKNLAAMVGSMPAGIMPVAGAPMPDVKNMMASGIAMPPGDFKSLPDLAASMPAGVMNSMTATGGAMPAGVMNSMTATGGAMPAEVMNSMTATGGAMPVGDMKAMDVMPLGRPMPEVGSMGGPVPMPMVDPISLDRPMLKGAPMPAVAYGAPLEMGAPMTAVAYGAPLEMGAVASVDDTAGVRPVMAENKKEMAVMQMKAPGGMSVEPSEVADDDGAPKMVNTMMAASPGADKAMVVNKAHALRSPEGANPEVVRTQAKSVDAVPPKVAKGAEEAKKADGGESVQDAVSNDADNNNNKETKKTGGKQPSRDRKFPGAQRKNGAKTNNGKKNGVAKKAQNGGNNAHNKKGANKKHNGANKIKNSFNKSAQIAPKKGRNSASGNLKEFARPVKKNVVETSQ